ncbi:MAG TPA: DUF4349 domain-containing protein [Solirubrobacteraceae bacterium]
MRRHEPTLDPAAAAELEALEAALAGDPAAEPELAALVRDVRAEAPAMTLEFRSRLDRRVERGFERALPRRRFKLRPLVPALGVAGCVGAAIVAVVLTAGGGSNDNGSAGVRDLAAPLSTQGESADSAKSGSASSGAGGSGSAGSANSSGSALAPPTPSAPARQRRVERSTRLELTTTDVQSTSDGVVRATQATGGFVQSSQVATGDGHSTGSFVLRVPTSRLDDALARLSRLGHVRSMQQSADDITNVYNGASTRLAEARAERRGLLRALAKATTAAEISSLRARIADNRRALQRDQRAFDAVRNRANYATIGLEVTGVARKHAAAPGGGSWTPGDAAHDAVRVLEVSAGVALIALAVLVPLTLVGAAGGFAAVALRRRRREAALSS